MSKHSSTSILPPVKPSIYSLWFFLWADFPSLSVIQPSTSTHTQASTVQGLVSRIVGDRASQFNITVNTRKDRDTFMVSMLISREHSWSVC